MLRIEIGGYLSQQVFEPNLIAKYSANTVLFWEDTAVNYQMLLQLAALFLGMSAGSVPVECLLSDLSNLQLQAIKHLPIKAEQDQFSP